MRQGISEYMGRIAVTALVVVLAGILAAPLLWADGGEPEGRGAGSEPITSLAIRRVAPRLPVSPVIYPDQRLPLRFSHVQHLTLDRLGIVAPTCLSCHAAATRSRSSLDNLMPRESACRPCHAIDRGNPGRAVSGPDSGLDSGSDSGSGSASRSPSPCVTCHPAYDRERRFVARVHVPAPNIKFDHAGHAARGIGCTTCHGDLVAENVALATRAQLPAMTLCLGCHDGKRASARCTTCHVAGAGGRVETRYSSGILKPSGAIFGDAHDLTFERDHRAAAQNNLAYCESCHQKRECQSCHDGSAKPWGFHPGDYATAHAIDARRNEPDCSGCHRSQTFCTGCHSRSGVSADGRGSEFSSVDNDRRFHPAGWADATFRGTDHHAIAAQRNIRQCAACHREQFCVSCHSAERGAMQANPHPPGWATSRRCRSLRARNFRVCLRCHTSAREARCVP